jgi:26S proteasome regulatory subunit N5
MDTREKLEFIMYQMKIMILKKDMINLLIVSRKLGKKSFVEPNLEDLQILYNCYLYILYHSEKEYLQSATALLTILDLMIKDPIP